MSRKSLSTVILCTIAFTWNFSSVSAQGPMPQATEHHQTLKNDVGTWDAESKFWMTPDGPPVPSKAVEVNTMMGDFWLLSEYTGDMMGQKFFGRAQLSYDPYKKKYVGTWIDSTSPVMATMEGTYDKSTNSITFMSTGINPMTGKEEVSKMVGKTVDEDHRTFVAYGKVEGKEGEWWKKMEIKYTRRK